jgi:hypothetical protein
MPMQLDIFEHSRDVMLRNAAIDALRTRDVASITRAIAALAAEYAGDPLLPAFTQLLERLRLSIAVPLNRASATEAMRFTENAVTAAQRVLGATADAWMSPLWANLATAIADFRFDPDDEELHAAPLLLRAGNAAEAARRIEAIASWRRQPAPLAWKVETEYRVSGLAAAWPLLAELSWLAPPRAATLAARLQDPELNGLLSRFDVQFEGDGETEDFAWFPAWALIAEPARANATRLAQHGADTTAERCAWLVLNLLLLERQGRHADIIDGRRKLRAAHPRLFELYMRSR